MARTPTSTARGKGGDRADLADDVPDMGRPDSPPNPRPRPNRITHARGSAWLVVLFWAVFLVVASLLCIARIRYPGPETGEFWSDSNVMNAARVWDDTGFTSTWGIPRLAWADAPDSRSFLYVTYPPGPYWLSYAAMLVGRAMGAEPVLAARVFAQACGLLSVVLLFFVFRRLARSRAIAALGAMFYMLSPAFLSYSAALHHMAYSPMLLFGAMLAWLAFEDGKGRGRLAWLALTALLFAADCYVNFEHMVYFALFVGVRTAFHTSWQTVVGAGLVGPIPIPVMLVRVWHNAQMLGGWDAAVRVFRAGAERRSLGNSHGLDLGDLATVWVQRLGWPWVKAGTLAPAWNMEFLYPALDPWVLGALATILLSLLVHRMCRPRQPTPTRGPSLSLVDPSRTLLPLHPEQAPPKPPRFLLWPRPTPGPVACGFLGGVLLLACGLTWFGVMTEHTRPHRFIVLLLMPGLSLLLGTVAWGVIASARRMTEGHRGLLALWIRARAWLLCLAMLAIFALHVRDADVLNQLTPLDRLARGRVEDRLRKGTNLRTAGEHLTDSGIRRVLMFDGAKMIPFRAAAIGVPFTYVRETLPEAIGPSDALFVEAIDDAEVAAALDAAERFGLPDLVGAVSDRMLVFRGSRSPGDADVRLRTGLLAPAIEGPGGAGAVPGGTDDPPMLVAMRWDRALSGDQCVLTALFKGALGEEARGELLTRFVVILKIRDARGAVVLDARTRLGRAAFRDSARALVVLSVPGDALPTGSVAEVTVWDRDARTQVRITTDDRGDDAQPTDLEPGGKWIRWHAR